MTDFPVAYQATKAAVINLTRNLACSWADRGVLVNAIAAGRFPGEMTAPWWGQPPFLVWAKRLVSMGQTGNLEELIGPLLVPGLGGLELRDRPHMSGGRWLYGQLWGYPISG